MLTIEKMRAEGVAVYSFLPMFIWPRRMKYMQTVFMSRMVK